MYLTVVAQLRRKSDTVRAVLCRISTQIINFNTWSGTSQFRIHFLPFTRDDRGSCPKYSIPSIFETQLLVIQIPHFCLFQPHLLIQVSRYLEKFHFFVENFKEPKYCHPNRDSALKLTPLLPTAQEPDNFDRAGQDGSLVSDQLSSAFSLYRFVQG